MRILISLTAVLALVACAKFNEAVAPDPNARCRPFDIECSAANGGGCCLGTERCANYPDTGPVCVANDSVNFGAKLVTKQRRKGE